MRLAIQSVGRLPRVLDFSAHGYDWRPFLEPQRDGYDGNLHFRVFGIGIDARANDALRYYYVSLGARWLINICAGAKFPTPDVDRALAHPLRPASMFGPKRFGSITVCLLSFEFSRDDGQPWRVRFFWNNRRVFHKRG